MRDRMRDADPTGINNSIGVAVVRNSRRVPKPRPATRVMILIY